MVDWDKPVNLKFVKNGLATWFTLSHSDFLEVFLIMFYLNMVVWWTTPCSSSHSPPKMTWKTVWTFKYSDSDSEMTHWLIPAKSCGVDGWDIYMILVISPKYRDLGFDFLDFRAGLGLDKGLWTWDGQHKNEYNNVLYKFSKDKSVSPCS